MNIRILILSLIILIAGCKQPAGDELSQRDMSQSMAILYSHYAAEYRALTWQAYNIATLRAEQIAASGEDVTRKAVVLDIDETVLDNSPYQARSVVEGFSYPVKWDDWCNLGSAGPIPGAREFLLRADELGFKIFYVSNRKEESVYKATLENLRAAGFPQVTDQSLLLRQPASEDNPDPSDKESRRSHITGMGYSIELLVGDNLGDFFTDELSGEERAQNVDRIYDLFGSRFIVLPNAMYGNWPASIGLDGSLEKQILRLDEMSQMLK